jgi:hypothetical protein
VREDGLVPQGRCRGRTDQSARRRTGRPRLPRAQSPAGMACPDGEDLSVAVDDDLINLRALPVLAVPASHCRSSTSAFITAANPALGEQVASVVAVLLGETPSRSSPPAAAAHRPRLFSLPPVVHVDPGAEGGAGLTIGVGDLAVLAIDTDDGQRRRLLDGVASHRARSAALSIDAERPGHARFLSARGQPLVHGLRRPHRVAAGRGRGRVSRHR